MTVRESFSVLEDLIDKCKHLMPIEWHESDRAKVEDAMATLRAEVKEMELKNARRWLEEQLLNYQDNRKESLGWYYDEAVSAITLALEALDGR